MMAVRDRWLEFWYAPVSAHRLAAFRAGLLYVLAAYTLAWAVNVDEWLTPAGYHPATGYYAPRLPLLPEPLAIPFVVAYLGSMALALFARKHLVRRVGLSGALAGAIYVMQADPVSAFTINRLNVICLLVLVLAPPTFVRADDGPVQAAWPLRVLQLTLLLQYLGAGVCKVVMGEWAHSHDILWSQIQGFYRTDLAAWMVRMLPLWAFAAMQHMALAFEVAAPVLFAVRRLRPAAFVLGLGMHLLIALTMEKLIYFSAQMAVFYLLFIPAPWAARIAALTRLGSTGAPKPRPPA